MSCLPPCSVLSRGSAASRASRGPASRRRAFNLLEILVVLAIIGLIAAVSFVTLLSQMPKIRMTNRAAETTAYLNRMRQTAVRQKEPVVITVEDEEVDGEVIRQYLVASSNGTEVSRFLVGSRPDGPRSGIVLRAPGEDINGPESITFPSDTMVFLPNGRLADIGAFRLGDFRDANSTGKFNVLQIDYPAVTGLPKIEKYLYPTERPSSLTAQEWFPERIGGASKNIWSWY